MLSSGHIIDATFEHQQGYKFNIRYKTKGRFVSAVRNSRHCKFLNAVDYQNMSVIKPDNFEEYVKNAKV